MKRLSNRQLYTIFNILFIALNLIWTYFLTLSPLNQYIISFGPTFWGTFNAILGNLVVLFLLMFVSFIFVKRRKKRMLTLLIITFFLNTVLFALTVFSKYYGTTFSIGNLSLFKNPAQELGVSILVESLKELFTYYRIILYIPTFILLILFFLYNKKEDNIQTTFLRSTRQIAMGFSGFLCFFMINVLIFNGIKSEWKLNSSRSTYVVQNIGVYSYYVYDLLGFDFRVNPQNYYSDLENDELIALYESYNKNKSTYQNTLDGNYYSNELLISEISNTEKNLYVDSKYSGLVNGMFSEKNVVLIHLETFNYYLLDIPEIKEKLPFLNKLLSESYVLENFYTNFGVGTSADAEFSVLTGLHSTGDSIIYWDYTDKYNEELTPNSLVKYFSEKDYFTKAIHGDVPEFYNRINVYPKMYEFDEFYDIADFIKDGYSNEIYNHKNPWISDYALADKLYETQTNRTQQEFLFPMPMMPHTPFLYDPFVNNPLVFNERYEKNLSSLGIKFLRYMQYYDSYLERMFVDPNTGDFRGFDDTVYIFYGDHGAGLGINDIKTLYNNNKLTDLEYRQISNRTLAFIYAPSSNYDQEKMINKGELIGTQTLVRSQIDMYRTIIELCDLPVGNDMYFGVNLLSKEPTYSIDNRALDCITDTNVYSSINLDVYKNYKPNKKLINNVIEFKMLNDHLISSNLFNKLNNR